MSKICKRPAANGYYKPVQEIKYYGQKTNVEDQKVSDAVERTKVMVAKCIGQ
jgi:hypothetical protein